MSTRETASDGYRRTRPSRPLGASPRPSQKPVERQNRAMRALGRLHPGPLRVHRRLGTTDDARIRDITQAVPLVYADRLFTAREQGATEQQRKRIAAEGLGEMYFRANNTRAHGLGVEFTDAEQIDISL
ncbi:telomere-protecting terminal protein Tpg [Streptomyces sp. NPDC056190]|uniref:telomere-protecting terminal protein Tpg n=1 Tax=unclassified Streptomyces TaxID=2593676 RepID=UPI0035DEE2ED